MISVDWQNKIVESTASILDLPVFHAALRDLEDSSEGVIHPVTHTWKALDQGGGAFMYQADLINGYHLKFPVPGNYEISGNLKGVIDSVAGVYVERQTSTAYITTAQGSTGPTAESIAVAVIAALNATPITTNGNWPTALQNASAVVAAFNTNKPSVNVATIKDKPVIGSGTREDPWRPA